MPFEVRVMDLQSKVIQTLWCEAADEAGAMAHCESRGQVALSAKFVRAPGKRHGTRPRSIDVAWWCKELKTLLQAGMTVVEAIDTLCSQSGNERLLINTRLASLLAQGQSLSVAMGATQAFPDVLIASVKASERTSSLVEALDDYLRYDSLLESLRKKVVSAAIYPAVVAGLGFVITLVLLLFVIPRFSKMYADLHGPVSSATRLLMLLSRVVNQQMPIVFGALLLLIGLIAYGIRSGRVGNALLNMAESIEPLRRRIDMFRLAKLYHSLALMFRGGFSLHEALDQCRGLGLGGNTDDGIQQARAAIASGRLVSGAFSEAGLTDVVSARLLAVGERSGNFDKVLQTIAERYANDFALFMERATRIVEPMLLLAVALLVGGIVVMMYMPIFDMASSVR